MVVGIPSSTPTFSQPSDHPALGYTRYGLIDDLPSLHVAETVTGMQLFSQPRDKYESRRWSGLILIKLSLREAIHTPIVQ